MLLEDCSVRLTPLAYIACCSRALMQPWQMGVLRMTLMQ